MSVAAAAVGGSLLVGCGNESDGKATDPAGSTSPTPSASETSSEPTSTPAETDPATGLPVCSQVWVDGGTLPADYKSCSEDGTEMKPVKRRCGYGGALLEHDGRFYAMKGNEITEAEDLASDADYQQILATCQA